MRVMHRFQLLVTETSDYLFCALGSERWRLTAAF